MGLLPLDKFNINRFWEKTPTPLKYILVITLIIATTYFLVSKRINDNHVTEIQTMRTGIVATYELIDNFEDFRKEQEQYNKDVIAYLENLHTLIEELNTTTNKKFELLLKNNNKNTEDLIEKIAIINESFEKLSTIYRTNIDNPDFNDNKIKKTYDPNIIPTNIEKENAIEKFRDNAEKLDTIKNK